MALPALAIKGFDLGKVYDNQRRNALAELAQAQTGEYRQNSGRRNALADLAFQSKQADVDNIGLDRERLELGNKRLGIGNTTAMKAALNANEDRKRAGRIREAQVIQRGLGIVMKDPTQYGNMRSGFERNGIPVKDFPLQYDPNFVKNLHAQTTAMLPPPGLTKLRTGEVLIDNQGGVQARGPARQEKQTALIQEAEKLYPGDVAKQRAFIKGARLKTGQGKLQAVYDKTKDEVVFATGQEIRQSKGNLVPVRKSKDSLSDKVFRDTLRVLLKPDPFGNKTSPAEAFRIARQIQNAVKSNKGIPPPPKVEGGAAAENDTGFVAWVMGIAKSLFSDADKKTPESKTTAGTAAKLEGIKRSVMKKFKGVTDVRADPKGSGKYQAFNNGKWVWLK